MLESIFTPHHEKLRLHIINEYVINNEISKHMDKESIDFIVDDVKSRNGLLNSFGKKSLIRSYLTSIIKSFTRKYLFENNYISPLISMRTQLVHYDTYGDKIMDDWYEELHRFTRKKYIEISTYVESNLSEMCKRNLITLQGTNFSLFPNNDEYGNDDLWELIDDIISDEIFNNSTIDPLKME